MDFKELFEKIAESHPCPELPALYWVEPRPHCSECREFEVMNYGDICEHCQQETKQGYKVMYKMGRLANGFALDRGTVYHAVKDTPDYGIGSAICGTKTGRRSAGWHRQTNQAVTCKACIKRLK